MPEAPAPPGAVSTAASSVDFFLWRQSQDLRVRLPFLTATYLLVWALCWYVDDPVSGAFGRSVAVGVFFAGILAMQVGLKMPPAQETQRLERWRRRQSYTALAGAFGWGASHAWLQTGAATVPEPAAGLLANALVASVAVFVLPMRLWVTLLSLLLMLLPSVPVILLLDGTGAAAAVMLCAGSASLAAAARWVHRDYCARLSMEAELLQQREHYQRVARIDELTLLACRQHFDAVLQASLAQARRGGGPVSLALFDLQGFTALNDQHGHDAGDMCLQAVADGLRRVFRREADVLGRVSGDGFAVLLPHTALAEATRLVQAFLADSTMRELVWKDARLQLTLRSGVGAFDAKTDADADAFMQRVHALSRGAPSGPAARNGRSKAVRQARPAA